jgi:hypothetical protein
MDSSHTFAIGSEQAAADNAPNRGTPAPSDATAVARLTAANSIIATGDAVANDGSAEKQAVQPDSDSSTGITKEVILEHLASLGFTEATFADLQPSWRWRLINLAISAGSGAGHCMTLSQLHYLRAELDYRMLHGRHAAMTHHLARLIRSQLNVAEVGDAAEGVAGAGNAADDDLAAMDVDVVASTLLLHCVPTFKHCPSSKYRRKQPFAVRIAICRCCPS